MTELPPILTRIAGISFENPDGTLRQAIARRVQKGDPLALRREPLNAHDANAIAVTWLSPEGEALQLGYVPRALAELLAGLVDRGAKLSASVDRTGGGGKFPLGIRMKIEGDFSAVPKPHRSGLEPAIAEALAIDEAEEAGLAPMLGGLHRPHQA